MILSQLQDELFSRESRILFLLQIKVKKEASEDDFNRIEAKEEKRENFHVKNRI